MRHNQPIILRQKIDDASGPWDQGGVKFSTSSRLVARPLEMSKIGEAKVSKSYA